MRQTRSTKEPQRCALLAKQPLPVHTPADSSQGEKTRVTLQVQEIVSPIATASRKEDTASSSVRVCIRAGVVGGAHWDAPGGTTISPG